MFGINFSVTVDSSVMPDMGKHKDFVQKSGSIPWWKHKHWEIQISKYSGRVDTIFRIHIDLALNGLDHGGPKFYLEIFGYVFDIHMYDARHWNHDENRWWRPEDEDEDY